MYKKLLWIGLCAFTITLIVALMSNPHQTSAIQHQASKPPISSTALPVPFDFPGAASLLPGNVLAQARQTIRNLGYDLKSSRPLNQGSDDVQFEVRILWQRPNNTTSDTARLDAYLITKDDLIVETYFEMLRIGTSEFSDAEWRFIDPKSIYSVYRSPDIARAWLFSADDGVRGMVLAIWSDVGIAVLHDLILKPSDFPSPYTTAQLCFTPDRVRFSRVVIAPDRNLSVSLDRAYNGFWTFGQPFSPTMFTNAPDLATFAQRLANGECLETPSEVWFK